jgi:hypothetical protein
MCQYVMCANEGICRQTNTSACFTCDCKVGFTGTMCQVKEDKVNTSKEFFYRSLFWHVNLSVLFKQIYATLNLVVRVAYAFFLITLILYANVLHLQQDVIVKK